MQRNQYFCLFVQILSKDSVTVFVNAIMYYRVEDAIKVTTSHTLADVTRLIFRR